MDNEKEIKEEEKSTANEQESTDQQSEETNAQPVNDSEAEQKAEEPVAETDAESETTPVDEVESVPTVEAEDTEAPKVEEKPEETAKEEKSEVVSAKDKAAKELNSEEDLSEKDEDEDHDDDHDDEDVDYSTLSKEELVEHIRELAKSDKPVLADKKAKEIKPFFDEIRNHEREEALKKFIADGGEEADFEFRNDELAERFDANLKLIRDRKSDFVKNREQQKDQNLKKKQDLLERLREFVDSEETTNINFDDFKALQDEWKSIGPVPGAQARTLWANYNALIDRFYDNRSIYFELKELDRKKNLEGKLELCERAEALSKVENIRDAVKELNELHHEFKHIGPVPKEEQEPLWQRFKAASDAVYDRRRAFVENLKGELEENLVKKQELVEEVKVFTEFDSDRIKEWNAKTQEILAIQKKWEAIGGLPRAKAKDVNKNFWGSFKTFFNNKNAFFKKLDAGREENYKKKQDLLKEAQELKDSTEWQKTAEAFKKLQRQWKDIGPVPEKKRGIYQDFKAAADEFFENKRANNKELEKDFVKNYKDKLELCEKIEKLAAEKSNDLETFRELRDTYLNIGFVPRKNISEIKSKYSEAVDKFINSLEGVSNEDRQKIRLENQLNRIIQGPNADQKLYRKEQAIRKQIGKVENDIALWKNNIEFFAESKTADKMKEDFQKKIKSANNELKSLKQQLKIIRTAN